MFLLLYICMYVLIDVLIIAGILSFFKDLTVSERADHYRVYSEPLVRPAGCVQIHRVRQTWIYCNYKSMWILFQTLYTYYTSSSSFIIISIQSFVRGKSGQ